MKALSKFKDRILKLKVSDIMTTSLISCNSDDLIEEVMQKMTQHHIRHLPVFDSDKLVGIISIGDLVHAVLHVKDRRRRK